MTVHVCATKINDVIKDIDFYDSNVIVMNDMFMENFVKK